MPARLIQGDDVLLVKLGGTKEEFAAQLARVKTLAGKRYNPQHPEHGKIWEVPDDDATLLKLVATVEPELPPGLLARVRSARQEQATEVVTKLPDDAELSVPWADRMAGKQRAGVEFMLETAQGRALLADDPGAGKTLQSISAVYEFLIHSIDGDKRDGETVGSEAGANAAPPECGTRCGSIAAAAAKTYEAAVEQGLLQDVSRQASGENKSEQSQISGETPGAVAGDGEGGEGQALRGLSDQAAVGSDADGSRTRDQVFHDWTLTAGKSSNWIFTDGDFETGAGEVCPALSKLPRIAALPRLIIAPNSVLGHWQRELKKWVGVRSHVIDGKDKKTREQQIATALEEPGAWIIVNWEKLQKRVGLVGESAKKKAILDKIEWAAIIADESHKIKNHDSQTSRALRRLHAPVQLALSGTPVLNNPGELWAQLAWLKPEQYTSFWAFYHSYTESYQGYEGRDVIIGVKNADGLRFELADKMVRRRKRDIHPDIPEPLEPIFYEPPMGAKQAKIYSEAEKDFWLEIAQATDISAEQRLELVDALESDLSIETVKMMIPNAAARTMRMRQVATSPALLGGDDVSSKLDEAEQIVLSNGIDEPFVWFAWFRGTVDLLVERFRELGADARGFHGGNSTREDRAAMAAAFQAGEFPIICATIKTGGTGIDLYRAADCGFIEEDWVPGENQQAFDRIDRKGQGFHPQRHILRAPDTVDVGKIAPKLATKQLIVETITGGMG